MSNQLREEWPSEIGVGDLRPPTFFRTEQDLNEVVPPLAQAHALRRAFRLMGLDGILCLDNAPIVYIKRLSRLDDPELQRLQLRVWNQGIAGLLIILSDSEVRVYSGMIPPVNSLTDYRDGLIKTLNWTADALEIGHLALALGTGEFLRTHARAFDPDLRVDRRLLNNLSTARNQLHGISKGKPLDKLLDALLCRIVFTCYLVDRGVIGASYFSKIGASDARKLQDLFANRKPSDAADLIYRLFEELHRDFNGDLFGSLGYEREHITSAHIECLGRFLSGEDLTTGQLSFLSYDFSIIPIETISSIYEHFLASDTQLKDLSGAIYTPRFLAESVIGTAIEGIPTLLDKRVLDPACGSGIFLVGLFNRMAEEWQRQNNSPRYDLHAKALIRIIQENIFGVDRNPTACRIAAFSLYLALLDQLSPSDIQELQKRGQLLPPLVFSPSAPGTGKTILQASFGEADPFLPKDGFDIIIGNPPWVSRTGDNKIHLELEGTASNPLSGQTSTNIDEEWPYDKEAPVAQKQIAYRFVWKSSRHLKKGGRICFLLPHGILFNHDQKAISLQLKFFEDYSVEKIVNLSDLRYQLFEGAIRPAIIVRYGNRTMPLQRDEHGEGKELVNYITPKTDWASLWADVLAVGPEDSKVVDLRAVRSTLKAKRAPTIWKELLWGTPRDWKFLDRLASLPKLNAIVGQPHKGEEKRWVIGQGFQPMNSNDGAKSGKEPWPPEEVFVAGDINFDLILLREHCRSLGSLGTKLRRKPQADEIFDPPHVLVSKGMKVAFSNFRVVFQHALQGIHGPDEDQDLLMFLAAFLSSPLAKYFLFHTASNWGTERPEVHLDELLRVPFPLPEDTDRPETSWKVVRAVASIMRGLLDKEVAAPDATTRLAVNLHVYQYFELDEAEVALIRDTLANIIPSVTPRRPHNPRRKGLISIPTLDPSTEEERAKYLKSLSLTLNSWARGGPYEVAGKIIVSSKSGLGIIHLKREPRSEHSILIEPETSSERQLDVALGRIKSLLHQNHSRGHIALTRELKIFAGLDLFIFKHLARKAWTQTAALNDADEIAASILTGHRY